MSGFIDYFCDQLNDQLTHDLMCKQQSSYIKGKKKTLKEGEFLCVMNFAENYAFVLQNAAQGFHWNNNQATIFPAVIYYREGEELKNKNYVITSDNLTHDAVAVHTFTKLIVHKLKEEFETTTYYTTRYGRKIE